MGKRLLRCAVFWLGILPASCASTFHSAPQLSPRETMLILEDRASRITTLASRCRVLLSRDRGRGLDGSVQLDGALAFQPPHRLRIRAWKLSQPVFDLTLRPDGLWLFVAESEEPPTTAMFEEATTQRFAHVLPLVTASFDKESWTVQKADPGTLRVSNQEQGDLEVTCEIDRATITLRHCQFHSSESPSLPSVRWEGYRRFGEFVFPTRIRFDSHKGTIVILLDEPVFNEDLAPLAFEPPPRALRRP